MSKMVVQIKFSRGGIEIPCTYKLYGMKKKKESELRNKIRDAM